MKDPESDRTALMREAARILIRLNESPDDRDAVQAKDAFVARGAAEKKAFETALRMHRIGGRKKPRRTNLAIVCVLLAGLAAYMSYAPLRTVLLADWDTDRSPAIVTLASGDMVHLDASTAITDATDGPERDVRMLQGAGFFDVDTSERPFAVAAGPLTATALGTAFEVSRLGEDVRVSVAEGRVEVRLRDGRWQLQEGERLTWSPGTPVVTETVSREDIATWREGRFVVDGLTFGQVIDVVDRRLPGRVLILGRGLADAPMTGTVDLNDPQTALDLLAASRRAKAVTVGPLVTVIRSAD